MAAGATARPPVALVQLPFPSQTTPLEELERYYELYMREYLGVFPDYGVGTGDLWELPLWVAHLDGALGRDDTSFVDLSRARPDAEECASQIRDATRGDEILFFSPLTQNFPLARAVSRSLRREGRRTAVGGNMAGLADIRDFTWVHVGQAGTGLYEELVGSPEGRVGTTPVPGRHHSPLSYRPRYRLLDGFRDRVPLLRLHASHGCLFSCTFCGDAWTKQLHEVRPSDLAAELDELQRRFPRTRLLYVGDKTFGQSRAAVAALLGVVAPEYGYRVIVQTHIATVSPKLVADMVALGVEVVELGFETANSAVLRELLKGRRTNEILDRAVELLDDAGLRVVLNVLGGLPNETAATHRETLDAIAAIGDRVWLYNLYNFVPYPKTPMFPSIRGRIVDWDFTHWREDRPVVFVPYHQSREEAWEQFLGVVDASAATLAERRRARNDTLVPDELVDCAPVR